MFLLRVYLNTLSAAIVLFLFSIGIGSSLADPLQAVVLFRQGDRATINRGASDGVVAGQTWYLTNKASLVVEEVREHSSIGRLEGEALIGNIVTLSSKAIVLPSSARSVQVKRQATEKRVVTDRSLQDLRKRYQKALSEHTKKKGFVTPIPGQAAANASTGLEAYNLYQLYDITNEIGLDPTGAYLRNPLILATAAAGMYQQHRQVNQLYESARVRVDVEATLWDEELADLQTEVEAADKGLSVQDTLTKKVQNITAKGVDKYVVLEVRVRNTGKTEAQLEPFKYRVFMMSAEGEPIAASRVDPVLDKTLQPGDEIRGMVYFPKIVAAGQSKLRIAFEQMFGDRGTLVFEVR